MDMKQTVVEWLEKICNDRGYHLMEDYFKQAKAMEKEQIEEAYRKGYIHYLPQVDSEDYYNKTFKLK